MEFDTLNKQLDEQLNKDFESLNELYEKQQQEQERLKIEQEKLREEIKQRKELLKKNKSKFDYLTVKQKNSIKFQLGEILYKNIAEQKNLLHTCKQLTEFLKDKKIIK
ncbi:TPA: hypothetical protein QB450_001759 [Pasteurella multocida]|nr:hypothetical protein [Pasteurella multocida]HEA3307755.1 hypothetical protein [Pasteurella multocida]